MLQADRITQSASSLRVATSLAVNSPSFSSVPTSGGGGQDQSRLSKALEFARHDGVGGKSKDPIALKIDRSQVWFRRLLTQQETAGSSPQIPRQRLQLACRLR